MRFFLMHVDSFARNDAEEEAYVITPGAEPTALAVPIDALPDFLPLLSQSVKDLPPQRCPCCEALLATAELAAPIERCEP